MIVRRNTARDPPFAVGTKPCVSSLELTGWSIGGLTSFSVWMSAARTPAALIYRGEHSRHEHQRRNRCEQQTAYHGAADRRVLLTAITERERHGHHADDHRQRRHQY